MAVPEKIQNRTNAVIKEINDSKLPFAEKDDLREIIVRAAEGSNGLTPDDKIQATAENLANLTYLFTRHMLTMTPPPTGWKDVIIACKWPLVIITGIIAVMLILQPQLATVIDHAVAK